MCPFDGLWPTESRSVFSSSVSTFPLFSIDVARSVISPKDRSTLNYFTHQVLKLLPIRDETRPRRDENDFSGIPRNGVSRKRVFDDNRFEHNSGGIREGIVKESRSN